MSAVTYCCVYFSLGSWWMTPSPLYLIIRADALTADGSSCIKVDLRHLPSVKSIGRCSSDLIKTLAVGWGDVVITGSASSHFTDCLMYSTQNWKDLANIARSYQTTLQFSRVKVHRFVSGHQIILLHGHMFPQLRFLLKLTPKHQVRTKQIVIGCFACLFLSKWVFVCQNKLRCW